MVLTALSSSDASKKIHIIHESCSIALIPVGEEGHSGLTEDVSEGNIQVT